jgi:hypothetical protein
MIRWGLRCVTFTGAMVGSAFFGSEVAPTLLTPAVILAVLFFILGLLSLGFMVLRYIQWLLARRTYFRHLPPFERKAARDAELKRRGAPLWYIGSSRAVRTGYGIAVLAVAVGVVLIRPFPGDSNFGLRIAIYSLAFFAAVVILWRLRSGGSN